MTIVYKRKFETGECVLCWSHKHPEELAKYFVLYWDPEFFEENKYALVIDEQLVSKRVDIDEYKNIFKEHDKKIIFAGEARITKYVKKKEIAFNKAIETKRKHSLLRENFDAYQLFKKIHDNKPYNVYIICFGNWLAKVTKKFYSVVVKVAITGTLWMIFGPFIKMYSLLIKKQEKINELNDVNKYWKQKEKMMILKA